MCIYIYIYIYIYTSLSLSLYIYIYIYDLSGLAQNRASAGGDPPTERALRIAEKKLRCMEWILFRV